jgi:hypothetical protein
LFDKESRLEQAMFISSPEKTYGQTSTMRVVLLVPLALILIGVFAAIDFDTPKTSPRAWTFVAVIVGLYILSCWAIGKSTLKFHPEGIAHSNVFNTKEIRWEEVAGTYYTKIDQNLYVHFGLVGLLLTAMGAGKSDAQSGQMNLKILDGEGKKRLNISSMVKDSKTAIREVLNKVNPRIKAELQRQVQGGQTVMFGPVSLSRQGIGFKQKPQVSFAEVTIKFNGTALAVKKEGKWLNEFKAPARKVPNVFVLLDLAEEMKLGGAPRPPDPFAHMGR